MVRMPLGGFSAGLRMDISRPRRMSPSSRAASALGLTATDGRAGGLRSGFGSALAALASSTLAARSSRISSIRVLSALWSSSRSIVFSVEACSSLWDFSNSGMALSLNSSMPSLNPESIRARLSRLRGSGTIGIARERCSTMPPQAARNGPKWLSGMSGKFMVLISRLFEHGNRGFL
ncbi:MAG: hypothetical protein ACKO26_14285 [Planctomycetota bacterium]